MVTNRQNMLNVPINQLHLDVDYIVNHDFDVNSSWQLVHALNFIRVHPPKESPNLNMLYW